MAESRELDVALRYSSGAMHDMQKYCNSSSWLRIFLTRDAQSKLINERSFTNAKNALTPITVDMQTLRGFINEGDVASKEFRDNARKMQKHVGQFLSHVAKFKKSGKCSAKLAKQINRLLPSFRMLVPLTRVFVEGKVIPQKTRFKLKPLLKELERQFPVSEKRSEAEVIKLVFRVRGSPTIYADKTHLHRAMFNIFKDAVEHSKGEPVTITVGLTKNNLVFASTNKGVKLAANVVKLIGNRPYTSRPGDKLLHGFGKIAARDAVLAHGGKFEAKNAPKGFRIQFTVPRGKRRVRVA